MFEKLFNTRQWGKEGAEVDVGGDAINGSVPQRIGEYYTLFASCSFIVLCVPLASFCGAASLNI